MYLTSATAASRALLAITLLPPLSRIDWLMYCLCTLLDWYIDGLTNAISPNNLSGKQIGCSARPFGCVVSVYLYCLLSGLTFGAVTSHQRGVLALISGGAWRARHARRATPSPSHSCRRCMPQSKVRACGTMGQKSLRYYIVILYGKAFCLSEISLQIKYLYSWLVKNVKNLVRIQ